MKYWKNYPKGKTRICTCPHTEIQKDASPCAVNTDVLNQKTSAYVNKSKESLSLHQRKAVIINFLFLSTLFSKGVCVCIRSNMKIENDTSMP